jgi:hypothetical protein
MLAVNAIERFGYIHRNVSIHTLNIVLDRHNNIVIAVLCVCVCCSVYTIV